MPKFKITDNQTGKTVIISGDTPPTEADAEQIFTDAGLRGGAKPAPQMLQDKITSNPIMNFILGNSLRIPKDLSSGIKANMTEQSRNAANNQAFQTARTLENQAANTSDPTQKKELLSQANNIYSQVSQGAQDVSQSFSKDVTQNPLWRGVKSGSEIAALADVLAHPVATTKAVYNTTKNIGKNIYKPIDMVMHPFKTVGNWRNAAIEGASDVQVSGNKLLDYLQQAGKNISPTDKKAYDAYLETAKGMYKDTNLGVDELTKLNNQANKAYTMAGNVGKSAKATFNKELGNIIKTVIKEEAPNVAKANDLFSKLYSGQKFLNKTVPRAAGYGVGGAIGSYILSKILGGSSR